MTTPNTGIGAITARTLRTMRARLDEAAAIARAAEDCAMDGQPGRALMMALDVEPLAVEANSLLQSGHCLDWAITHSRTTCLKVHDGL